MKKISEMHKNDPDLLSTPADGCPEDSAGKERFRPEENTNTVIYGPPESFENNDHFEPEDNRNEVIYGPPEVFGLWRSSDPCD